MIGRFVISIRVGQVFFLVLVGLLTIAFDLNWRESIAKTVKVTRKERGVHLRQSHSTS